MEALVPPRSAFWRVGMSLDSEDESSPREKAVSELRTALAAIERVPAVALDRERLDALGCAREDVLGIESAIRNELDQKQRAAEKIEE